MACYKKTTSAKSGKSKIMKIYGVRKGNGMMFFYDAACTNLKAWNPYRYYRKDQEIKLNGFPYKLIVKKSKKK